MKSKKVNRHQSVQIIAGTYRHRKINFIEATDLRPTGARIRETLFNWIAPIIHEKTCLDLFAGSGILGFEALSRGAKQVTFVEKNNQVAKQIEQNLQNLNINNATLINTDYQNALQGQYDIVFLDPPYVLRLLPTLLAQIEVLAPKYIFIEDNQPIESIVSTHDRYHLIKSKKAGGIYYGLLQTTKA